MKTFLVVEQQSGGCDYTIGCGVLTYTIEAESIEAAVAQLKHAAFSDGDFSDEEGGGLLSTQEANRDSACVYEVSASEELPLGAWRKERKQGHEKRHQEAQKRDELATLAKLQKKYGANQ